MYLFCLLEKFCPFHLVDLRFYTSFQILSVLYALPTGIKKRAHPYLSLPSKSTNTTVIKPQSQNSSETVPNKTVAAKTTTEELCPTHQVAHNTSKGIVCCVPYFNCGIGKRFSQYFK